MHYNSNKIFIKIWSLHFILYFFIEALFFLYDLKNNSDLPITPIKIVSTLVGSLFIGLYGMLTG